jgi:hypothetical protein
VVLELAQTTIAMPALPTRPVLSNTLFAATVAPYSIHSEASILAGLAVKATRMVTDDACVLQIDTLNTEYVSA